MKKIILITSLLIINNLNSQNLDTKNSDIFLDKFSVKMNNSFKSVFEISKKEEKLLLNDFKNLDGKLIELTVYNKDELKSDLYKRLPSESVVIGSIDNFIMCKVPMGWNYESFVCDSGYFIVTIVGLVNVYKN